jgi:hypothetical protein
LTPFVKNKKICTPYYYRCFKPVAKLLLLALTPAMWMLRLQVFPSDLTAPKIRATIPLANSEVLLKAATVAAISLKVVAAAGGGAGSNAKTTAAIAKRLMHMEAVMRAGAAAMAAAVQKVATAAARAAAAVQTAAARPVATDF